MRQTNQAHSDRHRRSGRQALSNAWLAEEHMGIPWRWWVLFFGEEREALWSQILEYFSLLHYSFVWLRLVFSAGDVVGCGIDFHRNLVFYTLNGTFLGMCICAFLNLYATYTLTGHVIKKLGKGLGTVIPIYPSVGLRNKGETVRVNFGHELFDFDIENYVSQE